MAASQLLISGMPLTFGTVTSDVLIIAGYTNRVKNKCSYKIKESQNCDSFIIRHSDGAAANISCTVPSSANRIVA